MPHLERITASLRAAGRGSGRNRREFLYYRDFVAIATSLIASPLSDHAGTRDSSSVRAATRSGVVKPSVYVS